MAKQKIKKLHVKKGDTIKVIAGNERGKTAKVLEVNRSTSRVIVEGLNLVTKHTKPSANNPEGGREKVEAGIHISNVMLVDPANGEATRIGRKLDEENKLQRYSKKTGEIINNG